MVIKPTFGIRQIAIGLKDNSHIAARKSVVVLFDAQRDRNV